LIDYNLFNNASVAPGEEIVSFPVTPAAGYKVKNGPPQLWQLSYSGFFCQYARWWHGSIKYLLRFTTSSFVTTRVRISHVLTTMTSSVEDVSGDLISQVVDVTGTTEVPFSVPYLSHLPYLECGHPAHLGNDTAMGAIEVTLVDKIVSISPTDDPPVYWSLWQAVGDDFRFMKLDGLRTPPSYTVQPKWVFTSTIPAAKIVRKPVKASSKTDQNTQCDIRQLFQAGFPGLADAKFVFEASVVNGEDFGTLQNLLKRYCYTSTITTSAQNIVALPYVANPLAFAAGMPRNVAMTSMFMFMRGSARVGSYTSNFVSLTPGPYCYPVGAQIVPERVDVGMSSSQANNSQWVEVPWYDNRFFIETIPTIDTRRYDRYDWAQNGANIQLHSVGDDFSVGCLSSPPLSACTLSAEEPPEEPPHSGYHGHQVVPKARS
jgi:hypothetical protein